MSDQEELETLRQEIAKLRRQVAVLTNANLELRRRVRELESEKNETGVEEVALALVHTLRNAELAMAEEAQGQRRYTISEMETTLRTFIAPRADGLALRLPDPEQNVNAGQLSSVQIKLAQVPARLEPSSG